MKTAIILTITVLAFIISCFGYLKIANSVNLDEAAQIAATNTWMLCDAVSKCMWVLATVMLTTTYVRQWLLFIFAVTVNNLMDELWFNPFTLGWNEAVIIVVLAVYYSYSITRSFYGKSQ